MGWLQTAHRLQLDDDQLIHHQIGPELTHNMSSEVSSEPILPLYL
jgi:hypothetical protein